MTKEKFNVGDLVEVAEKDLFEAVREENYRSCIGCSFNKDVISCDNIHNISDKRCVDTIFKRKNETNIKVKVGVSVEQEKISDDPLSVQHGGSHYNGAIQPIEFYSNNNIPFSAGNVIKYVFRHRNKNKIEDLKKAKHYIEFMIKFHDSMEIKNEIVGLEEFLMRNQIGVFEGAVIEKVCHYLMSGNVRYLNDSITKIEKLMKIYE